MKIRTLLAVLIALAAGQAWGAVNSSMVWEIDAATGNANNGGGFDSSLGGTNYAWGGSQNAYSFASSLSGAAGTTLTDANAGFTAAMVGNVINISGQGYYEVT